LIKAERMRPQAVVVGARHDGLRQRAPAQAAKGNAIAPYRLTRRIHSGVVFELFRSAARGELGPGCYIVKRPRDDSAREIALAMFGREVVVAAAVQHPNLTCVWGAESSIAKPYSLLPFR